MKTNDIVTYYNAVYNEDSRLSDGCDNRHLIERAVKMYHYKNILSSYAHKNLRIADISCGTGLYSIELAKLGCNVYACDLCSKHIDLLNEKVEKLNLNIQTFVCDARNLPFDSDSFDLVLLAGAVYHLPQKGKVEAIDEAVRVCRSNGYILIDFLPKLHAEYQSIARYGELLHTPDPVFSYDSKDSMKSYLDLNAVNLRRFVSTDGITRFIRDGVNHLTKEQLNRYIAFCIKNSTNEDLVDLSEHAIMDIIKW